VTASLIKIEPSRAIPNRVGGQIAYVAPGSPAALAGLCAGDWLLAINGLVIRDVIDYSYETAGEALHLAVERDGVVVRVPVQKEPGQDLGLEFTRPVFEGIRECNNTCEFCFISGLPKGLRRSLYIRDDDYRYSYLFGSFLTLTNLDESDWQRIGFQHLSPLYVSVHATDLDVRRRMLRNPNAPDILAQIDRLQRLSVQIKAQVVVCPGENDGEVLERTVRELADRAATVDSVAIVPVGLTRYSRVRGLRSVGANQARALVRQARVWQRAFRQRLGRGFVYLSDELYLLAGARFPAAWRYDGYRQLQNGVGLTRLMLEDWRRAKATQAQLAAKGEGRVIWLCGRAAGPALRAMAADLECTPGLEVQVLEAPNDFFGGSISVSGLLAGRDMVAALKERTADRVVAPRSAFGFDGHETLDGWTPADIERETGLRLVLASKASELLEATLK
jgi:putative radical SAM enzyme (TIGR03279 family)